ncbi:hypothetical protein FRC08_006851, partial [Ceratobasidium sp. 394]
MMEHDEDAGARKERCFCCDKKLEPGGHNGHNDHDNPDLREANVDPYGDGIGGGDVALEGGAGEAQDFGAIGEALDDVALNLDNGAIGDNPPPLPAPPPPEPVHIHEPQRNPRVTIEEWPEPGSDDGSEVADFDEELVDGPDQDPPYIEPPAQPLFGQLDPLAELDLGDADVRAALQMQLGDLTDDEWMALYNRALTQKDRDMLRLLATRIRTHFSRQTYDELRLGLCEERDIP